MVVTVKGRFTGPQVLRRSGEVLGDLDAQLTGGHDHQAAHRAVELSDPRVIEEPVQQGGHRSRGSCPCPCAPDR
jgi:hypothetical protein